MIITRAKGGTLERKENVKDIRIPDMWHLAMELPDENDRAMLLECWHLAHDLLRTLQELKLPRKTKK